MSRTTTDPQRRPSAAYHPSRVPPGRLAEGRSLLVAGAAAGPVYVVVGALEMALRPGFDIRRHDLSLVANGSWGWIHIAMMVITGLATIAGAVGVRRTLRDGAGGRWGPILLGVYGAGVTGAGFFIADPALGFPPGTPADARTMSWHGALHLVFGSIGFLGLIGACLVLARRFRAEGRTGLAVYSALTGIFFFVASATGIGAGSGSANENSDVLALTIYVFTAAVLAGWVWTTVVNILCFRRGQRPAERLP